MKTLMDPRPQTMKLGNRQNNRMAGIGAGASLLLALVLAACGGSGGSGGTPGTSSNTVASSSSGSSSTTGSGGLTNPGNGSPGGGAPVDTNCASLTLPAVEQCKVGGGGADRNDVVLPSTACPQGAELKDSTTVGNITVNSGAQLVVRDQDTQTPVTLTTAGISVTSKGSLLVGNQACPIGTLNAKDTVTMVFTGDRPTDCPATDTAATDKESCHSKGIVASSGATVQLYGIKGVPSRGGVSWTYLARPAGPAKYDASVNVLAPVPASGTNTLYLAADVQGGALPNGGWQPNDWIVVATTSFSPFESEFVQIGSLTPHTPTDSEPWSTVVTLKNPLAYYHFGGSNPYALDKDTLGNGRPGPASYNVDGTTNYGVDERAEVGLISRNIVLTSDADSTAGNAHWGGEVRILAGFTSVRFQGVQLQKFSKEHLGSYPLHLHMTGPLADKDVLLDADSVDHSYNKCVTVHMTNDAKITNMVCARIVGHIFYEEWGSEQNTIFQNNLGVGAMSNGFDVNNGASVSNGDNRDQLIQSYWWNGDNMVKPRGTLIFDGFRVIDTDNIFNPSHGNCQVYFGFNISGKTFYNGGLNPPPGPYSSDPLGNDPKGCSQIPDGLYYEPASGFWITNLSSKLIGNSIAGCQGFGNAYWLAPAAGGNFIPIGSPADGTPYTGLHGEMINNRGHGCQSGIYSEPERTISLQPFAYVGGQKAVNSQILMNIIDGITLTRNRNRGIWLRPSFYLVRNARLATNRLSASLVTSGGPDGNYPGEYSYLTDSVVIGISKNNVDRWGNPNCANRVIAPNISQVAGGDWGCLDQTAAQLGTKPTGADFINVGYDLPNFNMLGYMIYDGPALIFHDRFVHFRVDPTSTSGGLTNLLDTWDKDYLDNFKPLYTNGSKTYEGDAALGWFNSPNPSAYPVLTASKLLSFFDVDLRHQIFTDTVNQGSFQDGDKNTALYDLDGTLSGLTLANSSNMQATHYFPISLNNLPFNANGYVNANVCSGQSIGSVDECKAEGAQNTVLEGIPTGNMSPAEIGSLEVQAQFPLAPNPPAPPAKPTVIAQALTFTRDDPDFATVEGPEYHSLMKLNSRNSQGIWEPKVASGFGYTMSAAAGIPPVVQVGLVDTAKPDMSASNPFYVRVGICYTGSGNYRPTSASAFTITRGYQSWGGGSVEEGNAMLRKYYNQLDAGLYGDQTTPGNGYCFNLTNQTPGNSQGIWLDQVLCPSVGIGLAPTGSCTNNNGGCGSLTCTQDKLQTAICIYPTSQLTSVNSIAGLTTNGMPNPNAYYYDSGTGMLYFYVEQAEPNAGAAPGPGGPSPLGNCTGSSNDPPYCPSKAGGFDTYYVCPAEGCGQYKVTLTDSNYTPAPSTCTPYPTYDQTAPVMDYHLALSGNPSTPLCRTASLGNNNKLYPHYTGSTPPACAVNQP